MTKFTALALVLALAAPISFAYAGDKMEAAPAATTAVKADVKTDVKADVKTDAKTDVKVDAKTAVKAEDKKHDETKAKEAK